MTDGIFTMAVLSDQHIDCEGDPASWKLAKNIFKKISAENFDHVLIVGDLFDCASAMKRDCERVSRYLKRQQLWHRDKMTIVVGNHDIFHTPHRGKGFSRALEFGNMFFGDAQKNYEHFCCWAGDLSDPVDRLSKHGDLFPLRKELSFVRLFAMDTTASETLEGSYGSWSGDDDKLVRANDKDCQGRRLLAIHNAPQPVRKYGKGKTIRDAVNGEYPDLGYHPMTLKKLSKFIGDLKMEAVLCGHIHNTCGEPYDYLLEHDQWKSSVHIVGRTGGMDFTEPSFGVLKIPKTGELIWDMVQV